MCDGCRVVGLNVPHVRRGYAKGFFWPARPPRGDVDAGGGVDRSGSRTENVPKFQGRMCLLWIVASTPTPRVYCQNFGRQKSRCGARPLFERVASRHERYRCDVPFKSASHRSFPGGVQSRGIKLTHAEYQTRCCDTLQVEIWSCDYWDIW
jgi:hypothetical protein